jgi:hypothetical protein
VVLEHRLQPRKLPASLLAHALIAAAAAIIVAERPIDHTG